MALVWKKIFHPCDFSKGDEKAFLHALKIAVNARGQIGILHVGPRKVEVDWSDFPRVSPVLHRWGVISDVHSKSEISRSGLRIVKARKFGHEPSAILTHLRKHPADLVVLATHQRGTITRWMHQAVAEPLARRSGIRTLFVPRKVNGFIQSENGAVNLKNILVPVDHHPHPQAALDAALSLAQLLKCPMATLTLLYVGDEEDAPMVKIPEGTGYSVRWMNKRGAVVDQILEASDEVHADLIVMTTQGHRGILDVLIGSTTERVLRESSCPILAVPMNG